MSGFNQGFSNPFVAIREETWKINISVNLHVY